MKRSFSTISKPVHSIVIKEQHTQNLTVDQLRAEVGHISKIHEVLYDDLYLSIIPGLVHPLTTVPPYLNSVDWVRIKERLLNNIRLLQDYKNKRLVMSDISLSRVMYRFMSVSERDTLNLKNSTRDRYLAVDQTFDSLRLMGYVSKQWFRVARKLRNKLYSSLPTDVLNARRLVLFLRFSSTSLHQDGLIWISYSDMQKTLKVSDDDIRRAGVQCDHTWTGIKVNIVDAAIALVTIYTTADLDRKLLRFENPKRWLSTQTNIIPTTRV